MTASTDTTRRGMVLAAGAAAAAAAGTMPAAAQPAAGGTSLARAIYESFARNELDRWDALVHPDVVLNSSGNWGAKGLPALKTWAAAFHTAFRPKIDLVDEFAAGDRAVVVINHHWKHDGGEFFGVKPTGRSGTSVEVFLLKLRDGKVAEWGVADQSLDLSIYLWERGFPIPHNVVPTAIVKG